MAIVIEISDYLAVEPYQRRRRVTPCDVIEMEDYIYRLATQTSRIRRKSKLRRDKLTLVE